MKHLLTLFIMISALAAPAAGMVPGTNSRTRDTGNSPLAAAGMVPGITDPAPDTTQLRFTVTDSKACPLIKRVAVYNAPDDPTDDAM